MGVWENKFEIQNKYKKVLRQLKVEMQKKCKKKYSALGSLPGNAKRGRPWEHMMVKKTVAHVLLHVDLVTSVRELWHDLRTRHFTAVVGITARSRQHTHHNTHF